MSERPAYYTDYQDAQYNDDGNYYPAPLKGPRAFEAWLTEPEDRTWDRDGSPVVRELNRLAAEVKRLEGEKDSLLSALAAASHSPSDYRSRLEAIGVCDDALEGGGE